MNFIRGNVEHRKASRYSVRKVGFTGSEDQRCHAKMCQNHSISFLFRILGYLAETRAAPACFAWRSMKII